MLFLPLRPSRSNGRDSSRSDHLDDAFVRMLEVRVLWGDQLLSLQYLRQGTLAVGEGTTVPIPDVFRLEVARMSSRGPEVFDRAHAGWIPVPAEGTTFAVGTFTVCARLTNACRAPAPPAWSWNGTWQLALSFALHVVVLVVLANPLPAFAGREKPPVDDRIDTMRRLLAVADEHAAKSGLPSTPRIVRPSPPADDSPYFQPSGGFTPTPRGTRGGASRPELRQGFGMSVSGKIPAEVVTRIVRQTFGRFRLCYEAGLRHDAHLAGTVVTRFVIDRTGGVSTTRDGGSSLPSRAVIACVVRGFSKLSFPQPEAGIVTVSYPIVFAPGS